jgi:hypothetical protein
VGWGGITVDVVKEESCDVGKMVGAEEGRGAAKKRKKKVLEASDMLPR